MVAITLFLIKHTFWNAVCTVGDPGLIPGQEDPLEESTAMHSSVLAWRIPMDRGAWQATVHVVTKSWTRLSN